MYLKSYRNTVPVPRHWPQKRKYLQGKRGIEKPPFELPDYIQETGAHDPAARLLCPCCKQSSSFILHNPFPLNFDHVNGSLATACAMRCCAHVCDSPVWVVHAGIEDMRNALQEKMADKLKNKGKARMRPKMGRMDIDYNLMQEAFFKKQHKPPLTSMGDLYYEGARLLCGLNAVAIIGCIWHGL